MRAKTPFTALAMLAMALVAFTAAGAAAPPATTVVETELAQPVALTDAREVDGPDCRDLAAKVQRVGQAIREMEARLNDLQVKQDRLVAALRAVHAEMQDLQDKLDRIEAEHRQLDAEKSRLIQVLRDPNSSQADKDAATKRIREIEAEQADLRATAKRIHDRMSQLRHLGERIFRELAQTHRQIGALGQRLDDAKQLMHRMVSWYRANCP